MEYENSQEEMNIEQQSGMYQPQGADMQEGEVQGQEGGVPKNLIITVVIALVVVVLALMYLWGSKLRNEPDQLPPAFPAEDEQTMELKKVSDSDDLNAIEQDLTNTDLGNLDADLSDFEAELDASLN